MLKSKEKKAKKKYAAPHIEIEFYELDANIASHCDTVVNIGPQMGKHEGCEDFPVFYGMDMASYSVKNSYNVQFYEDTDCTCTNSSLGGFWTS